MKKKESFLTIQSVVTEVVEFMRYILGVLITNLSVRCHAYS